MVEIYSKSLVRAIGKVLLMEFNIESYNTSVEIITFYKFVLKGTRSRAGVFLIVSSAVYNRRYK